MPNHIAEYPDVVEEAEVVILPVFCKGKLWMPPVSKAMLPPRSD